MKIFASAATALFAFAMALLIGAGPAIAQAQRTPIPMDAMVNEPFLSQMQLSPDGRHLAALSSLDGRTRAISIWRTDALNQNPVRFGVGGTAAERGVQFASIDWVSNDRVMVVLLQPVTVGSGASSRTYTAMARIVNLDGSQWLEPLSRGGGRTELESYVDKFLRISVLDDLPRDEQNILVSQWTPDATFVYRMNVYNGFGERVLQLGENENVIPVVDREGRVRVKEFARYEGSDWIIGYEIFNPANNQWEEHPALQYPARQRRTLSIQTFDPTNPDILVVLDNEGQNFTYARGYSISQRAFVETLFQHPQHDAAGVIMDRVNNEPSRIVGFYYLDDVARPYWTDGAFRAMHESIQAQLPGRNIYIGDRRGDYRMIVAESSRHPPAYLLLENDTRLIPLGVSVRDIPSNQLAPTELVAYEARDGLRIPAFLTLPYGWRRGDPPLPTIIQPHGGPWSRNDASWGGGDIPVTQYFASRGFAVLQPQFRGSEGFGDQLWKAGDGQWGQAMQDDKDDGLRWLVEQGIADPNRAIIYGFSYGGFAAMAAVVRPNPPYRCAISGAGVASLQRLGTLWRDNRIQRQLQGWTLTGMDPLEHAADAAIPILLYHGDRDQTATLWHSEQFASALRAAGKPHEFIVIPDMPHGATTPDMRRRELTIVENFIRGTCGIQF